MHEIGRNSKSTIAQRLEVGARVNEYFVAHGNGGKRKWRQVAEECFHLRYSAATSQRLRRCWCEWQEHSNAGSYTLSGSGGVPPSTNTSVRQRARCRRPQQVPRPRKMACLWFELLQWFVDEVEVLRSRADSALLLKHAGIIRDRLLDQGHTAASVPKINKHFLRRWRLEYGICMRATTVRFKVSLTKAIARVKTMMCNILRLRHLWKLCFGDGVPMRWVSFDQKPSWFNNAGLRPQFARKGARKVGAREDHHGTRQRYTVMTTVQSWPSPVGGMPPKTAVLFKADNGARRFTPSVRLFYMYVRTYVCVSPGMCLCFRICVLHAYVHSYGCPCTYVRMSIRMYIYQCKG